MKQETESQSLNTKPNTTSLESQIQISKTPFYKRPICIIVSAILLLLLIITLIILIFTVFKAKDPTITLTSTKLSGVAPRVKLITAKIELNITVDLVLHVYNPNYVGFKHARGFSQVYYMQDQVGEVEIAPGNIRSRGSEDIKARLILEAEKFDMSSLMGDVLGGKLSFEIRTRVPGRAMILGFIKKHVVALSSCLIDAELPSMDISRQDCKRKTKL